MLPAVIRVAGFNSSLLEKMLADVADDKMCVQPPALPNHPAWTVGHLTFVRYVMHQQLGAPCKGFDEAWLPLFGRGSTPTSDRAMYPSKAALTGAFQKLQTSALQLVEGLSAAQLAGSHGIEFMRPAFPTLEDLLVQMFTAHDALHIGQLSDWRRAMNLPRIM